MTDRASGRQIVRTVIVITSGSAVFVLLRTVAVTLIDLWTPIPVWLNTLVVSISVIPLGWIYHCRVSFRQPLTRRTFSRYVHQALGLKLVDYLIINVLFYALGIVVWWAVPLSGCILFAIRVVLYFRYVFAAPTAQLRTPVE